MTSSSSSDRATPGPLPPASAGTAPARGGGIALLASAIALTLVAFGLAYSAYNACGYALLGFSLSNCQRAVPDPVVRRDPATRVAALEAEGEQLARDLGAVRDRLRQAKACPVPPPAPRAEAPPPAPPPAIRDDDWQNRKVESLQGCWQLDSDYRLQDINTKVITTVESWQVCFGADGQGQQTLRLSDGKTCTAPVKAAFPTGDRLELNDQADVTCEGGTIIFRRDIACQRQASATIDCSSHQPQHGGQNRVSLRRQAR